MRFSKQFKIHKACSGDEKFRPALCTVRFTGKRLIATDGHILAVVPVISQESDKDTPGNIPFEAMKNAVSGYQKQDAEVYCNGKVEVKKQDKANSPPAWLKYEKSVEVYPNYPPLVVKAKKDIEKPLFKVSFSVKNLARLAEALATDKVILSFEQHGFKEYSNCLGYDAQIAVESENDSYGILMPMKIED